MAESTNAPQIRIVVSVAVGFPESSFVPLLGAHPAGLAAVVRAFWR
jgi:hypothetical protein